MIYTGSCYCKEIRYEINLASADEEARTSICHCKNCKVLNQPIPPFFPSVLPYMTDSADWPRNGPDPHSASRPNSPEKHSRSRRARQRSTSVIMDQGRSFIVSFVGLVVPASLNMVYVVRSNLCALIMKERKNKEKMTSIKTLLSFY